MAYAVHSLVGIVLIILSQSVEVDAGSTCNYYSRAGLYVTLYCPYSQCCGDYNYKYCCGTSSTGVIVGGVLGFLFLVGIIASIVACCFCACCPVYQYRARSRGVIITTAGPYTTPTNYNTISGTTHTSKPPAGAYMAQPPPYQS